jgi:hypothetical protein
MPPVPRTLPTRLGAEDKLVDVYLFSLTVFQGLNILGGAAVASEVLTGPALEGVALPVRQVLAGLAASGGVFAAFWRHDGKSLWTWLWVGLRFSRLPRRAIAQPEPLAWDDGPDNRWYEVRPPLAWSEPHRFARIRE